MGKVIASITTSVDGYVTGPDDGPRYGLGRGGERLHYWVMGGPWTYEGGHDFAMHGPDKQFYDELVSTMASGVVGRGMYDAAGAWGGTNPFPGTLFVLTHRTADQPAAQTGFRFVSDLDTALARAVEAAGDGDVGVGGGADVIRQALAAGKVDELVISTAPVILGAGKGRSSSTTLLPATASRGARPTTARRHRRGFRGFPVVQACPDRAAPTGSRWSTTPAERPGPGRRGLMASGASPASRRRCFPERRGPGRVALATGGRIRVVGPEALPAGGKGLEPATGSRPTYSGMMSPMRTQVTFDCADPHAQAAFWAQVFGSVVEDHSALVDKLVADGRMPATDRITVNDRSAFRDVAACTDPDGTEPRLFFQRVPEGKTAKNRVHLDVHVDPDQKDAEVERLIGLGARLVATHSDRGPLAYVMQDPEGNEFCLH